MTKIKLKTTNKKYVLPSTIYVPLSENYRFFIQWKHSFLNFSLFVAIAIKYFVKAFPTFS